MLSVKSFKLSEEDAINKMFAETRLVKGSQILVSNGEVLFAVEDGFEPLPEHKIKAHAEQLCEDILVLEMTNHDMATIASHIEDLEEYRSTKEVVEKKKSFEDATNKLDQLKNQLVMKKAEVVRLEKEIAMRRDRINELRQGK